MFEKIRCSNFGGSCIGKTSGYKCAICSTKVKCEQEAIKRLEWLKKKIKIVDGYPCYDGHSRLKREDITDLIDQSQHLPIEQIEEELK